LPSGAPLVIAPFLIVIETISYFARVFSLSIRLFANLLAGHALMKIIGTFVWSTPLIAAGLINGLRPIANTHMGVADSFAVFTTQLKNAWNALCFDVSELESKANFWLGQNGIDTVVGSWDAYNQIINYLATYLVVFVSVGAGLFVVAHFFNPEIVKPVHELVNVSKTSFVAKVLNVFYGFRAWVISCFASLKVHSFDMKRQPGVWGMAVYTFAAIKHSFVGALSALLSFISRGTTVPSRVTYKEILTWNSYVAPVFSTGFWWIVVALFATNKFVHLVNFISYAHFAQLSFTWGDVFSSTGVWAFGLLGSGVVMAIVLSFLVLGDFCYSMLYKAAPGTCSKVSSYCDTDWMDTLAAIVVGLIAGWFQVSIYYALFDMSIAAQLMHDSLVYAAITRVGHYAFPYVLLFGILAYIFTLTAQLITKSMEASEARPVMKLLWNWGPVVILGLILADLMYWALAYDVLCGAYLESSWIYKLSLTTSDIGAFDTIDIWNQFRIFNANNVVWQIALWDRLWDVLASSGVNPAVAIIGAMDSAVYVVSTFVGTVIGTFALYSVTEIEALLCAGFNSFISLAALIFLPLITPLSWAFLLAITGLELVIGGLQAYVFITLSSMYLNDVIKLH